VGVCRVPLRVARIAAGGSVISHKRLRASKPSIYTTHRSQPQPQPSACTSPSPSSLSLCLRQCQPGVCSLLPAPRSTQLSQLSHQPPAPATSGPRPPHPHPYHSSPATNQPPAAARQHGPRPSLISYLTAHAAHRARAEEGTGASSTPMSTGEQAGEQGDPRSAVRCLRRGSSWFLALQCVSVSAQQGRTLTLADWGLRDCAGRPRTCARAAPLTAGRRRRRLYCLCLPRSRQQAAGPLNRDLRLRRRFRSLIGFALRRERNNEQCREDHAAVLSTVRSPGNHESRITPRRCCARGGGGV
jgi:hypothetical protein